MNATLQHSLFGAALWATAPHSMQICPARLLFKYTLVVVVVVVVIVARVLACLTLNELVKILHLS